MNYEARGYEESKWTLFKWAVMALMRCVLGRGAVLLAVHGCERWRLMNTPRKRKQSKPVLLE